jgi:hypothetical protein
VPNAAIPGMLYGHTATVDFKIEIEESTGSSGFLRTIEVKDKLNPDYTLTYH